MDHPPPPTPRRNTRPPHPTAYPRSGTTGRTQKNQGKGEHQMKKGRPDRTRRKRCRAQQKGNKQPGDESLWVLQAPVSGCTHRRAHTGAHRSIPESAGSAWTRSVHLDAPGQWHGQRPISGIADPRVVTQDKSSRGSVDTTRPSSNPQRVGLFSGERPVGAAKGKQTTTMASCQPPPLR